jgi:hypothetical protein
MKIFYLPGHGGKISNGLGQALVSRGYEVVGRETLGEFKKLDFTDQVDTIANDLKTHCWSEDAKIIANVVSRSVVSIQSKELQDEVICQIKHLLRSHPQTRDITNNQYPFDYVNDVVWTYKI